MTILAQLGLLHTEAQEIVAQAETAVRRLEGDGACQGHLLMATQILAALRHLDRIIEHHHDHRAHATPVATAGLPIARKRGWWIEALWTTRTGALDRTSAAPSDRPLARRDGRSGGLSTGLRSNPG